LWARGPEGKDEKEEDKLEIRQKRNRRKKDFDTNGTLEEKWGMKNE
jgi:hypothetical protein